MHLASQPTGELKDGVAWVGESAGLVLQLTGGLSCAQGATGTQPKHDSRCSVIVRTGFMLQDPHKDVEAAPLKAYAALH